MTETTGAVNSPLLLRWNQLLPHSARLGAKLLATYAEPARHYHDLVHLRAVLDTVAALAYEAAEPMLVRLAAWFHDAVYDVHRQDNEEQSAQLAESTLRLAGLTSDQVAEVARLVRLTASHDPAAADSNGAVLCDADLSILASNPERYEGYVRAVRQEYGHVSDHDWRIGRAAALEQLLELPALFRTTTGASWETAARHNLRTELTSLARDHEHSAQHQCDRTRQA